MTVKYALAAALCLKVMLGSASAYEVNFEDRPAGPSQFSEAGPAQKLTYDFGNGLSATFKGGVVLTEETYQTTDYSNVYATASFGDSSLRNPLTIAFSKSITNLQLDISNAYAGEYELFDNAGNSKFFSLASEGASAMTVGFAAAGTRVSIEYLDGCQDFAIDNVVFDQPLSTSPVPLPASAPMFGAALVALAGVGFGARRKARTTA